MRPSPPPRDPYVRVAAIAAVLWGLSVAGLHDPGETRRGRPDVELIGLCSAVERHATRTGRLPASAAELALGEDPWGRPWRYELAPGGDRCRVFTLGADGVAGGDGEAVDVSSWWLELEP